MVHRVYARDFGLPCEPHRRACPGPAASSMCGHRGRGGNTMTNRADAHRVQHEPAPGGSLPPPTSEPDPRERVCPTLAGEPRLPGPRTPGATVPRELLCPVITWPLHFNGTAARTITIPGRSKRATRARG